ncbi:hypothetical protein FVE85_2119 [Porphyridium purpureum]|uniref:N-acetyltransferase domain-containing protein n=1 Tax=Porphyridium purpureum TaxID=35688 RepID=A0A5J4YZ11_PORPP|nr:hypothetical protein FVE85_2119 [Porphyridium purpureum]|eukprot:POR5733..scf209_3
MSGEMPPPGWKIKRVMRHEMAALATQLRGWSPASAARLAKEGASDGGIDAAGDTDGLIVLIAAVCPCETPVAICEVARLPCPFSTPKGRKGAYIGNLFVTPQNRRRGIARALVRECERVSREAAIDDVFLTVESTNWPAMQFWRRNGFTMRYREPLRWRHLFSLKPQRYLYHRALPEEELSLHKEQNKL